MKIPKRIKIGAHWIEVRMVSDGKNTEGSASYHNWYQLITIRKDGTSESKQAECLLHEIIEAVNSLYQLNLKHFQINTLSEVLLQCIRDSNLDFRRDR
jgi:uncharacterized protein YpuA (DUF1002 family)